MSNEYWEGVLQRRARAAASKKKSEGRFDRYPDAPRGRYKAPHTAAYQSVESRKNCEACGCDMPNLCVVHHKDCNPSNNSLANLMAVCWGCHRGLHAVMPNWRYLTDEQVAGIARDALRLIGKYNVDSELARLRGLLDSKNEMVRKLKDEVRETWRRVNIIEDSTVVI